MNISNVALAAIIFAGGTAVGIATGTQMAPDSGGEEQRASVENAAVMDAQEAVSNSATRSEAAIEDHSADLSSVQEELSAQFEDLKTCQEQATQREAELEAQAAQLEEKWAALEVREEDLARMQESVRADSEALEDQQAALEKQEEVVSAQLKSVLERESQIASLEQALSTQSDAILTQELAESAEAKLDLSDDQSVLKAASEPKLSEVELSAVALRETADVDKSLGEGDQGDRVSEAETIEDDPVSASNAPIAEVHFEQNSATLTPGALKRAREAAARLQNKQFSKIRIAGHTDTTGSVRRNQVLSNQRAEAVAEIFVQAGLSRQMIEIVGFGETYAMLPISTADGISEPLNRCVGIFIE